MTNWLSDQWTQIRGNVKYEFLRLVVLALGGSGIIAALGAMSRRVFKGINGDWFTFASIFCCSILVFAIALFRTAHKQKPRNKDTSSNMLKIHGISETLKLGALWTLPTEIAFNVSVELHEIRNENEVVIDLTSFSIQYAGANVQMLQNNISTSRYVLPRASMAIGNDCVSHWDMSESSFNGFYVYLIHANKFAQEATLGVFAIDAFQRQAES